jgi:Helicase associated domain
MLEDMGFVWDSHNASWESKFNELCDFKRVHGHSFVPTVYPQNPQLAAWIKVRFISYTEEQEKWTNAPAVSVLSVAASVFSS